MYITKLFTQLGLLT